MDRLKSGAVIDRRDALMDLAGKMAADGRVACYAESHGARSLLLRGLDAAVKRGDEELIDAVSAAVAENSRAHAKEHKQVELKAVAGSQVGAAAQRPPGVEEVRLPGLGRTLRVHESSWGDAGLAWRIWGSAKIMAHAIDAANSHHDDAGGEAKVREREEEDAVILGRKRSMDGSKPMGDTARRKSEGARSIVTAATTLSEEDGSCDGASSHSSHTVRHSFDASPGGDSPGGDSPPASCRASPTLGVRGLTVLELGAGCGLCGFAAAAAGAKEVTVTEGAPGALAALTRTARDNASTFEGCRTRVKFLDWRDDQAALDGEEVVAVETNESGEMIDVEQRRTVAESESESNDANVGSYPPRAGGNWVHRLRGGAAAARNLDRLGDSERFDVVLGSDVMYDDVHADPLAASLARRIARPFGVAHVTLAVRRGELLEALARAASRRGLLVGAQAAEPYLGEEEALREATGGHITRAEPEGIGEWRERSGAMLAAGRGVILPMGRAAGEEMREAFMDAEGRVAMLTFRWPQS